MGWFRWIGRNTKITPEMLAGERRIMELEKRTFGRYTLFHERQSKEYKRWLKSTLSNKTPKSRKSDE